MALPDSDLGEAVIKLFSGGLAVSLLEFGAITGYIRVLGPAAVGSYFLFQMVIGIVGIPGDLGVAKTVEQQLSAKAPPGEVIATAIVLKAALLLPWLVGLLVAGPYVEQYIGLSGVLPLLLVGLVADQAQKLALGLLAGQLHVERTAILTVVSRVVWVVLGFGLVLAGWGPLAIVAAAVVGNLVALLGALLRVDLVVGRPRWQRASEQLSFGRYVFIGSVGGYIYSWMDTAILRLFVPTALIAAYEVAWRVASLSLLLTQSIRHALFPQISRWYAEERRGEIELAFQKWLQLPLYVTIPAFFGAVVLGTDVLRTLFGPAVVVAYPVLVVFMLEKILRSVHLILSPSLFAMNQPRLAYRGSLASIGVNLVLNLALIPVFGLLGAAVATMLSSATSAAINTVYVNRFVTLRFPWRRIGWSLCSALAMAVVVAVVAPVLRPGWVRLLLGVGTGVGVYFGLLVARKDIRLEVSSMLTDIQG